EATLGAWKHAEGDAISVDEPLVEVESEKATVEVPSPGSGVLTKILRKAGDTVAVGEVIAEIDQTVARQADKAPAAAKPANGRNGDGNTKPAAEAPLRAGPAARKAMAESGLSSDDVQGSGRGGRISKQDIDRAVEGKGPERHPSPTAVPMIEPAPMEPADTD